MYQCTQHIRLKIIGIFELLSIFLRVRLSWRSPLEKNIYSRKKIIYCCLLLGKSLAQCPCTNEYAQKHCIIRNKSNIVMNYFARFFHVMLALFIHCKIYICISPNALPVNDNHCSKCNFFRVWKI